MLPRPPEQCIVNFRDVGETLNRLSGQDLFPERVLYRGGRLANLRSHDELLNIPTILNLRPQKNPKLFDAKYLRAPAHDSTDIYDTSVKATRVWLNKALSLVLTPETRLPLYVHCTSGKDRTGVFVATLLKACGVDDHWIIQDYLASEGDVTVRKITLTLDGITDAHTYLRKVDIDALSALFDFA